ncbi:UbiA prenyltransferase [Laetiporus sulphureus 93-53]|uniref:UbiA prenyltransferase n=1 Tax=Laetiporus sulphureus 93-53 TaxID=1314785 RepID=A0A165DWA2_9APHY|nr:UbiA prenyltransferase [Laetiporus sulphureus 93-53]KZT05760.1 UbiA prenyltransferase [Laetiporus sulphureus 93-53]
MQFPWRGYYELTRLHKSLLGNALVFWPCAWGLTMSSYHVNTPVAPFMTQILIFAIGCIFLHSAGCVLNDLCDMEFGRKLERTKCRPLAAGIVSVTGARIFLFLLCSVIIGMLMYTNHIAALCGCFGLFPLHALYPLTKRWTWWPQGLVSWGLPTAWLSVQPDIHACPMYLLFFGCIGWTIHYDTMYASQDRVHDTKIGLKSTAVLFGDNVQMILTAFCMAFLVSFVMAGHYNNQSMLYYIFSCGGAAAHLCWQLLTWQTSEMKDSAAKYESNGMVGLIIWMGMIFDYAWKRWFI